MHILVTNDDGVRAPGIQALAQKMSEIGETTLVAPLEEKSAIGHGITIREPIRVHKMNIEG
ncbi:MAG: 5'/3'-nucleotidase SurE, partial [Clostridia bacterium]|nr:5'/3'-nucleotidase SurE [Clostridia bacterium]